SGRVAGVLALLIAVEVVMTRQATIEVARARHARPVREHGARGAVVTARAAVVDVGHLVRLVLEDAVAVRVDAARVLRADDRRHRAVADDRATRARLRARDARRGARAGLLARARVGR